MVSYVLQNACLQSAGLVGYDGTFTRFRSPVRLRRRPLFWGLFLSPISSSSRDDIFSAERTRSTVTCRNALGKNGGGGYRSPCLMHAKQALCHLSYTPLIHSGPCASINTYGASACKSAARTTNTLQIAAYSVSTL